MRRFEFVDGKSNKFWSVSLTQCDVETRWGRIGSGGQAKTKSYDDEIKSRKAYEKLIQQKTSKGYVEVEVQLPGVAGSSEPTDVGTAVGSGEERVVWGDAPEFVATRGGMPRPYSVDVAVAWAAVLEIYESRRVSGIAAGVGRTSPLGRELADALLASIEAPEETTVQAGAAMLLVCTYWILDGSETVARWMIEKHGLAFTTEAALTAAALGRDGSSDTYYVFEFSHAPALLAPYDVETLEHDTANALAPAFLEIRRASASASQTAHSAAVDVVARRWASLGEPARVLGAIAFPCEPFWKRVTVPSVEWGEGWYTKYGTWLIATPDDAAAAAKFAGDVSLAQLQMEQVFATVDRLGCEATAVFDALGDRGCVTWAPALEVLECRSAFALYAKLGESALPYVHVMERRPGLATQALAPIAADGRAHYQTSARVLLARLAGSAPDAMVRAAKALPEASAAIVRQVVGPPERTIATESLPSFLRSPPWNRRVKLAKPVVVEVEMLAFEPRSHMTSEEAIAARGGRFGVARPDAERRFRARLAEGFRNIWGIAEIADWEVALAVLNDFESWHFDSWYGGEEALAIAANWGPHAADFFVRFGDGDRVNACKAIFALEDPRLAALVAESYSRLKSVRSEARKWLQRFPNAAAIGLVPNAVGKAKRPREYAEHALRYVASAGQGATIRAAAARYGEDAERVIGVLLDADPFDKIPSKTPKLPEWWSPGAFPRLEVAATGHVLDDVAVDAVGVALALSKLDATYPGVPALAELCTPASLEAFALSVFEAWLLFGAGSKEYWALYVLGWFGRDEAARTLAPLLRRWPGESAAKRATTGLDVLALIGTDVALMHIYGISQKVKYKSIKKRAGELVDQLARELGLSSEELGDRLVPDFDLSPDGSTVVDYGTRTFIIRFDEALRAVVFDATGKRLRALPKPGKTDGEVAKEEQKRFRGLAKDVKAVAQQQLARLERSMCTGRRWSAPDFQQFFVEHPLIINLTLRLVWGAFADGELVATFRVDEGGELVDSNDEPVLLDGREVGIAHPLELGSTTEAWEAILADYEIVQPFPQITREVRARTPAEVEALVGATTSATKLVYGLERFGWRRGEIVDGGAFYSHQKEFGDLMVRVEYSGSVGVGFIHESEQLEIERLQFWVGGHPLRVDLVDPIVFSEAVVELARVTRP